MSPNTGRVITINVGGAIYTTYLATLTRFPDTMIATLFAGKHTMCVDERGNFFVDRDGELFRHILNFLRNPEEFEPHKLSPELFRNLQSEARYFGLLGHMFPYKPRKCTVSIGSIRRPNLIYSEKKVDNTHWVLWAQASVVVSRDECGSFRANSSADSPHLRFQDLPLTYCPACQRMCGIVIPEQHSIVTIAVPENEENVHDRRLILHFPVNRINHDPVHAKTAEHLRPEFRIFRDQCGECFECDE